MADNPYAQFFPTPTGGGDAPAAPTDSLDESTADTAKQVGARMWEGVLDLPGIVGDADEGTRLAGYHVAKGISQLLGLVGVDAPVAPLESHKRMLDDVLPTSGEFKDFIGYKRRVPTTAAGKAFDESWLGDIAEAAPGVIVSGPKKLLEEGLKVTLTNAPKQIPKVLKEAGKAVVKYDVLPQTAGAGVQAAATPILGEDWGKDLRTVTEVATAGATGLRERPTNGYFPTITEMKNNPNIPAAHVARTQMVDDAIQKAAKAVEKPGRDIDTVYRGVFEKLQNNPKFMAGSSPAERAAIDRVVDGGSVEKAIQFLGKKFSLVSAPMRAMAGIYIAYKYGGIEGAMAATGLPLVAKRTVGSVTKRSAEAAQTMYHRGDSAKVPLYPGGKPALKTGLLYYSGDPSRKEPNNPYSDFFPGRQ